MYSSVQKRVVCLLPYRNYASESLGGFVSFHFIGRQKALSMAPQKYSVDLPEGHISTVTIFLPPPSQGPQEALGQGLGFL